MHRAGAAMPVAALDLPGVRLDETECRNWQSQEIGRDLRKAGLVALAVRLGAEHQRDAAVRLEADLGALAWRAARGFEQAMPRPRSLPRSAAARRRAAKPS